MSVMLGSTIEQSQPRKYARRMPSVEVDVRLSGDVKLTFERFGDMTKPPALIAHLASIGVAQKFTQFDTAIVGALTSRWRFSAFLTLPRIAVGHQSRSAARTLVRPMSYKPCGHSLRCHSHKEGHMATMDAQRVSLTIPAAYLDDARRAIVGEVYDDSDALHNDPGAGTDPRILLRDVRLLEQLAGASADVELEADQDRVSDPLLHLLEAMARELSKRLASVSRHGPMPMGDVLDIAERLRWAADEAIRICPAVGDRLEGMSDGSSIYRRCRDRHAPDVAGVRAEVQGVRPAAVRHARQR